MSKLVTNISARILRGDIAEWSAASLINWHIGDAYLQLVQFNEAFKTFQEISRVNLENGFIYAAVGSLSKESYEKARYGDLSLTDKDFESAKQRFETSVQLARRRNTAGSLQIP